MPDTPLVTYLKIQRAADREILAALRSSAANVSSELKRLQNATKTGEKVRREQLLRSQAAINREMAVLFDRVGDTVQAGAARAAEAGARTILEANKDLLREALSASDYNYLVRSAEQSASNSLEALRQRVSGSSYVPLSQQVYDTQQLASGKIDEIVNAAIARGASAAELAKDVRAYINPNTPGGVRYASLRLGRTELNNAFHAAQIKQAQEEPWTYGLKWNLSGSHPRPDECNEYADEVHYKDGEAGVFRPEEVPAKPHPNCLCYTTPEAPGPDEFIDQYMRGDFDDYMDEHGLEIPRVPTPPPAPASVSRRPKAKPKTVGQSPYAATDTAIEDAVENVNPNAVYRTFGGVKRLMHRTQGSSFNCQKTSYAAELRVRGMKVVAEDGLGSKSGISDLRAQWKPRPGEPNVRGFSGKDLRSILKKTEKDPVGSRYIMLSEWENGGGHVYNAVKQSDGSLRFFDGQKKMLDATDKYASKSTKLAGFRVDNMEPAAKHRGIYKEEGK